MGEEEILSPNPLVDLFYVLDFGDALAIPFQHVFQATTARICGQLCSFAVNGALWLGFVKVATIVVGA